MTIFVREDVVKALRENKCVVSFTKVNGEKRDMYCTLKGDLIPEDKRPKDPNKTYSEEVIKVFDLLKSEWRSFKVANIIAINTQPLEKHIENMRTVVNG